MHHREEGIGGNVDYDMSCKRCPRICSRRTVQHVRQAPLPPLTHASMCCRAMDYVRWLPLVTLLRNALSGSGHNLHLVQTDMPLVSGAPCSTIVLKARLRREVAKDTRDHL